jgi:hypothetical protein
LSCAGDRQTVTCCQGTKNFLSTKMFRFTRLPAQKRKVTMKISKTEIFSKEILFFEKFFQKQSVFGSDEKSEFSQESVRLLRCNFLLCAPLQKSMFLKNLKRLKHLTQFCITIPCTYATTPPLLVVCTFDRP